MEKIRLKNGQEFNLIPMGIKKDTYNRFKKFDIIAELPHEELERLLLNEDNLKVIKYISDNGEVLATHTDCIALKSITKERGKYIGKDLVVHDVFNIVLITDTAVIRTLENEVQALKQENAVLKEEKLISELDIDFRLSILELGLA